MKNIKVFLPKTETLLTFLCFFATFFLFELLFRTFAFGLKIDISLFRVFLYSIFYSLMLTLLLKVISKKARTVVTIIIFTILTLLYLSQSVYYSLFGDFFNIMTLTNVGQATSFAGEYFQKLKIEYLFYFIPIIVLIFFVKTKKTVVLRRNNFRLGSLSIFALAFLTFFAAKLTFVEREYHILSDKFLFDNLVISERAIQEFGLLTYTALDIKEVSTTRIQVLDPNEIEMIDEYISSKSTHEENSMSGIFEDKNLILIMAESLDKIAVREDVMPNLYKMQNEGLYFENFYSPLYLRSTSDTEFMTETSMLPDKKSSLTMKQYLPNTFPNTFGNMFGEKDYATNAYHNFTEKYYPRESFYEETLSYDNYFGASDLDIYAKEEWPSDIELMEKAVPTFINEDKFFTKMVTVSGHLTYNDKHSIVRKNIDKVENIDADEIIKSYFATQVELDNAIGTLVDEVEKAGKLDDTVFAIYSDHRPYGLNRSEIQDNSEIERLNEIDVHRTPFVMWGPSVGQEVVKQPLATIDLMPTLANMFNLDMKYEYAFGTDVFSNDPEHIIQFSTFSWISDGSKYYSATGNFLPNEHLKMTEEEEKKYIENIDLRVYQRALISKLILRGDYYKEFV